MSDKNINDQDFENQSSEVADSSYDETYEDDVTYTEDDSDQWSDDVDLSEEGDVEGEEPAPQKKKSSTLTIIIILVVAVIGVFGFMILTGDKSGAPQPEGVEQVAVDADAAQNAENAQQNIAELKNQADEQAVGDQTVNITPPAAAPAPVAPQQGLMEDPNLLAPNTNSAEAPPSMDAVPSTMTAPVDMAAADLSAPAVPSQEVVDAISPTVKPVSDFPTVDSIKKPEGDVAAEPLPVPMMTANEPATSAPVQDDKSAQLQTQVDEAQTKISLLEKKLSDKAAELEAQKAAAAKAIAAAAAAPSQASGASDAEIDALRGKIADLEEQLAAKPVKAVVAEREVAPHDSYEADEPVVQKPVAVKPKVVVKQSWTLKSAGAGKAILADKATGDLKTVRVGDVVSGLGRIVSISDDSSAWIVKGTSGSVSE